MRGDVSVANPIPPRAIRNHGVAVTARTKDVMRRRNDGMHRPIVRVVAHPLPNGKMQTRWNHLEGDLDPAATK
jgi:hypothetical protein